LVLLVSDLVLLQLSQLKSIVDLLEPLVLLLFGPLQFETGAFVLLGESLGALIQILIDLSLDLGCL